MKKLPFLLALAAAHLPSSMQPRTFRWNLFMSEVGMLEDSSTYRVV